MNSFMSTLNWLLKPQFVLQNISCRLKFPVKNKLAKNGILTINEQEDFIYQTAEAFLPLEIQNFQDNKQVKDNLWQNMTCLVKVLVDSAKTDRGLVVNLYFFYGKIDILNNLNISIPSKLQEELLEKGLLAQKDDYEAIRKNFSLEGLYDNMFAYLNAYEDKYLPVQVEESAVVDDLEDSYDLEEDDTINISDMERGFKLFGRQYDFVVTFTGQGEKRSLSVKRILYNNQRRKTAMKLAQGQINFMLEAPQVEEYILRAFDDAAEYLDTWNKYSDLEGEMLLKKARDIGSLCFEANNHQTTAEGYLTFIIQENDRDSLKLLSKGDTLALLQEIPCYLQDPQLTWAEFLNGITQHGGDIPQDPKFRKPSYGNCYLFKIQNTPNSEDGLLILQPSENTLPAISGVLIWSIIGDCMQIIRRQKARDRIKGLMTPNINIAMIISKDLADTSPVVEAGSAVPKKPRYHALSAHVEDKLFAEHKPTDTQREAIKIALNTPDIAIIQGPPGTGKTTVITAILERLNEIADKSNSQQGQVLITSLQHDAVNNVIERIQINSIPTVKYGARQEDQADSQQTLDNWCEEVINKINSRYQFSSYADTDRLEELFFIYQLAPNDSKALKFLRFAKELPLNQRLKDRIDTVVKDINSLDVAENQDLLRAIYNLRTTSVEFSDDGGYRALKLYLLLDDKKIDISSSASQLLLQAARLTTADSQLLKQLTRLKKELLQRFIPSPEYKLNTTRNDVVELYEAIKRNYTKPVETEESIIYELQQSLANERDGVKNAISKYCFPFAATTQQSMHKSITEIKGNDPVYDTVIVDEAARVNPGDLMIPLSQAKTRIILVGDHRQLPHMYDEELFEMLKDRGENIREANIKDSMFENLLEKAKRLSADGRPRFITLDAQYRMHPTLGKFVSDHFYAQYGEAFKSPLPATAFAQPYYKKPLVWLDANSSHDPAMRDGYSYYRSCEASIIASKIAQFMDSTKAGHKEYTYGVITFYRAQVKKIKAALQAKLGSARAGKVRVGTVDAFQGMEFDVIFLSVVRSDITPRGLDLSRLDEEEYVHAMGQKNYGFLVSPNRLCVALSRQKKLLIVVGDSKIFVGKEYKPLADKVVPQMIALYDLCLREGVVENC